MDDMFVARLMSSEVRSVGPDALVEDAAELLLSEGIGSLVVVEDGRLRGILTSTDFVDIVARSRPKAETTVERYMTTDVVTVGAQHTVREAADAMIDHGIGHLPVVDGEDEVIGMLSTTDLTAYLADEKSTP